MFEIFQYSFMVRAFIAGLAISIIAPLIGTFLVARRYSLIADTLGHISLAGIAIGLLVGINPIFSALALAVVIALVIDSLRSSKRISGEAALAMFLNGGLALAVVLIGFTRGFNIDIMSYLFGSITTVRAIDLWLILPLGCLVATVIGLFYKEFFYVTFNEESAQVSGVHVRTFNALLMILTAVTVALSLRIVGALLIGALMVIPVITAMQIARSFKQGIFLAIGISAFSVLIGLFIAYYFNLAAGGTIVLTSLAMFGIVAFFAKR